jgi:hypothetical protein
VYLDLADGLQAKLTKHVTWLDELEDKFKQGGLLNAPSRDWRSRFEDADAVVADIQSRLRDLVTECEEV